MKRGDLVTVAPQGVLGKPRPAVIVQATWVDGLKTVTVLLLTSDLTTAQTFRILVEPTEDNGLMLRSQVMADKCTTLLQSRIGKIIGRMSDSDMARVDRALALFLGFA